MLGPSAPGGAPTIGPPGEPGGLPPALGLPGGPPPEGGGPPPEGAPPPSGGGGGPGPQAAGDQDRPSVPTGSDSRRYEGWDAPSLDAARRLFRSFDASDVHAVEPWDRMVEEPAIQRALASQDGDTLWSAIEDWLIREEYPARAVVGLGKVVRPVSTEQTARAASADRRRADVVLRGQLDRMASRLESNDPNLLVGASLISTRR